MGFVTIGLAGAVIAALSFVALTAFRRWKWQGLTQRLMDQLEFK